MNDEQKLEAKIQELGLTAPRLTPKGIDETIVSEDYYNFPGTTMTICMLTLQSGFKVIGDSSCISIENFDENIGREEAYKKARSKVWELTAYHLKCVLSDYEQYIQMVPFNTTVDK